MAQLGKAVKGRSNKKKKGDKATQQSSQDKALEEKIKRQQENDYMKRLAHAAKEHLKEKMRVETHNSKINQLRIQNQWRKIMRLAKVESLRKDIEVLSQNHERDVDRKDAIIQMLDRDLEEAEEQYHMALRSHMQNIDRLIDIQDSRLLMLENRFHEDLNGLTNEFNTEKDQIVRQHLLEKNELHDIMVAVEQQEHDRAAEAKHEHEQTREEIRNKNLEDINVLRITLESTIEELERHFESSHLNYLQNTDQRTQDFKYLTRKDQDLSKEIEAKIRKIEKLQASLTHWRTKINQNVRECEERNKALREEKDQISSHFQKLKSRLNKFRERQSKRLSDLAMTARETKQRMNDKVAKAERILKLAELARKLETENEKVLPFFSSKIMENPNSTSHANQDESVFHNSPHEGDVSSAGGASPTTGSRSPVKGLSPNEPPNGEVAEWNKLDQFFRKYNKVHMDMVSVENEYGRLREENMQLQSVLKQYLDGITVNQDVLTDANPLLVVNGRVRFNAAAQQTSLAARRGSGESIPVASTTAVEANHMVITNRVYGR